MSEYPSYLIHYGIQGQKWGVRRFQNEDGTYTDEGLMRRKDEKHFIAEQRRTNKLFDRVTRKIQKDQIKGKEVSEKRINKAIQLGTKHRALDYISKNPKAYLKAHGLNKASGAKFGLGIGAGATLFAYGGEGVIAGAIVERKLEKKFLKDWMRRQYGDIFDKCKDLTIKDLEEHGIVSGKSTKMGSSRGTKLIGEGAKDTASGIGDAFRTVNRTIRTTAKTATRGNVVFVKNAASSISSGVKHVMNGGDANEGLNKIGSGVKNSASEAYRTKKQVVSDSKNSISSVAKSSVNKIGTGAIKTAAGTAVVVQDHKKRKQGGHK